MEEDLRRISVRIAEDRRTEDRRTAVSLVEISQTGSIAAIRAGTTAISLPRKGRAVKPMREPDVQKKNAEDAPSLPMKNVSAKDEKPNAGVNSART